MAGMEGHGDLAQAIRTSIANELDVMKLEVHSELDQLHGRLVRLDSVASKLCTRLAPVLALDETKEEAKLVKGCTSPIGAQIHCCVDKLDVSIASLEDALRRLQI